MRKILFVLLVIVLSISASAEFSPLSAYSERFVSPEIAFSVAEEKMKSIYDDFKFIDKPIALYWLDDSIYAYMFLTDFSGSMPNLTSILSEIERRRGGDEKSLSLIDCAGYIIVSARYENNVILEYGRGVPYSISRFSVLQKKFNLPDRGKLYYTGHGRFFYEYNDCAFDLAEYKIIKKVPFLSTDIISTKWKSVLNKKYSISSLKGTAYIPDVPFVLWSYGCSPTTSSMIFSYYDSRGYGDLVDFYFTRFDDVMGIYRYNVPSAQRQLSVLMNTDSLLDGGTSVYSIKGGNETFANTSHPYSFTCGSHVYGQAGEKFFYPFIKNEVDSLRPAHWAVLNYYFEGDYIGHSIVSIGYDDGGSDTLIQVHNTWDYTEPFWNLYTNVGGDLSYSCFYEIKPAGGNSYRKGSIDINGNKYFKGLKGIVRFDDLSDSLNSIKLYYSDNNFATKNLVGEFSDSIFVINPGFSGSVNLAAEFLKVGGGLLATDGTYSPVSFGSFDDTNNLQLLSYTYDNSSAYFSEMKNDTLILLGSKGISEYATGDITFLEPISNRNDGNTYKFLSFINDTVLVAGTENALFTIKRADGYTFIDTFIFSGSLVDFEYRDKVAFLVTPGAFYAVNVNADFSLSCVDTFIEGSRKQYTSVALNDSFVYLTDLLSGIQIMKSSYPSTGFYGASLLSTSYNEAFADIKRDTLYLACLSNGLSVYSIDSTGSLNFSGNYLIGTVNKVEALESGIACINNSLGVSLRRYSTFTELSHIYTNTKITDVFEDVSEHRIFLSDNANGLFIGSFDPLAGVKESPDADGLFFSVKQFSRDNIVIDFHSDVTEYGRVTLFDLSGRVVEMSEIYFRANSSEAVSAKNLRSGIYFVKIESRGVNRVFKTTLIK
ncbi:MAG: T9SS type A sorting domain-containing protein [bacterium]